MKVKKTVQNNNSTVDFGDKTFVNTVAQGILQSLFTQGFITKSDLSLPQNELQIKISDIINRIPLDIIIDHRSDIIEEANAFLKQGKYDFAKLLYATFFEHSINHLIHHGCQMKGISDDWKKEVIKSVNIQGKFTWLLLLLGFPNFNNKHQKTIKILSDGRNAFVHYKWNSVNDNFDINKQHEKITMEFEQIRKAVSYMKRYSTNILFQKNKKHLDKLRKR